MKSELVTPTHLARKAVVYIRQSTPHQIVSNQESLRLQYALRNALASSAGMTQTGSVERLGVCGGGDMTDRAVFGWRIVDGLGVAAGRNARGRRDAQCRADGARIHALLPSFESEPARKLRRALDAVDRCLRFQSAP